MLLVITTCCTITPASEGQTRPAGNDTELRRWLENMVWHHRYSIEEVSQVTGLENEQVVAKLKVFRTA